jgi:hypothetical protein
VILGRYARQLKVAGRGGGGEGKGHTERNIDSQTAILVLPLELPGMHDSILRLGHKYNGIEDTRYGGGRDDWNSECQ